MEARMACLLAQKQMEDRHQKPKSLMLRSKSCGLSKPRPVMEEEEEEEEDTITNSAISTFLTKEEEIEKRKMEVQEKIQTHLGRVVEETKRLAEIRQEVEYTEAVAAVDEKKKERTNLISKFMELVRESEKMRLKKLEELSKGVDESSTPSH